MSSFQDRNPAADVARLYTEFADELRRYCQGQLRSAQEAEDAVQTTFVHAVQALRRGVTPESESAWLYTIARNVCHDMRRADGRRLRLARETELDSLPARDESDTDLAEELSEALATLPERQRRAFVMREWAGLSSGEVATRLGLRPAETYALLTRARSAMASALAAATGRAALALHLGPLLLKLRALFAGGAAKTAATATLVVTVAGGGLVVGQSADPGPEPGAFRSHRAGVRDASQALVVQPQRRESSSAETTPNVSPVSRSERRKRARAATAPRAGGSTPVASREPGLETIAAPGTGSVGTTGPETGATASSHPAPPRATGKAARVARLVPKTVTRVERVVRSVRLPDLTVPRVPELLEPVGSPVQSVTQPVNEVVQTVEQTLPALAEGELPPPTIAPLPPIPPAPPAPLLGP